MQAECCPPPLPGDERPLLQLSEGVSLQRGGKFAPFLQVCGFGVIKLGSTVLVDPTFRIVLYLDPTLYTRLFKHLKDFLRKNISNERRI